MPPLEAIYGAKVAFFSIDTARRKTRFVVRRGRIGCPVGLERENFNEEGRRGSRFLCLFWKEVNCALDS